jgi:splicing factor 3B subunit 5
MWSPTRSARGSPSQAGALQPKAPIKLPFQNHLFTKKQNQNGNIPRPNPFFSTPKLTHVQADKLRTQQQLEALQNKYIGTGHADTTKHEWTSNIMRDSYASFQGHPSMLLYMSVGMGSNVEAVRRHCMENMVLPVGPPPATEDEWEFGGMAKGAETRIHEFMEWGMLWGHGLDQTDVLIVAMAEQGRAQDEDLLETRLGRKNEAVLKWKMLYLEDAVGDSIYVRL